MLFFLKQHCFSVSFLLGWPFLGDALLCISDRTCTIAECQECKMEPSIWPNISVQAIWRPVWMYAN